MGSPSMRECERPWSSRHDDEGPPTETIQSPAKVLRIGSMVKELLEEVRRAPLDEQGRTRMKEIYETSVRELADGVSDDLKEELARVTFPFSEGEVPTGDELRVAQAQLVGWLEGLFHGIQAAMFAAQQMAMGRGGRCPVARRGASRPGPAARARRPTSAGPATTCSSDAQSARLDLGGVRAGSARRWPRRRAVGGGEGDRHRPAPPPARGWSTWRPTCPTRRRGRRCRRRSSPSWPSSTATGWPSSRPPARSCRWASPARSTPRTTPPTWC